MDIDAGGPSLAALVRSWRERALLTQEQLARMTGLGVRTIRRLESGSPRQPRSQSVRLLADALGLAEPERALLIATAQDEREQARMPGPARIPRQLPADVVGFVGRVRQLRRLDTLLARDHGAPTAVVVTAIGGSAGVGKTALAVHWAHRVAGRFPDGQLYVNLRGFGPAAAATDPATALRGFLDALDMPPARIPVDLDSRATLYRSVVADRRMLILLDNARDPEQVRPLLPGAPGCVTLVTSRSPLTGLVATEHAHVLRVDVLSTLEGRDLLRNRLDSAAVTAEAGAVDEIVARCARLPLALAIVAARAATTTIPLPALAVQLRDSRRRLDEFDTGDPGSDLRAVFSWSYERLSPEAARLFRLLGVHPGPDITAAAAASLAGLPCDRVTLELDELIQAQLISEHAPRRFTFHDLLRAFAIELADGRARERHEALTRTLDHYLHAAYGAATLLHPLRRRFTPEPPHPGVNTEAFATDDEALAWFTAEHHVLTAVIRCAADAGYDRHTYQLAWSLTDYFDWRGHWSDWANAQMAALHAAERLADPSAQVLAYRGLAGAAARQGDYDTAHKHLLRALDLSDERGGAGDRAQVHLNLSMVAGRQQRQRDAVDHSLKALQLCQKAGDRVGEGDALGAAGWAYSLLGEHHLAATYCRKAFAVQRELGNREGQAAALDSLGHAYHHLGRHSRAIACYQEAIELCQVLKNRYYEAFSLHHLGDTHHAAGNLDHAHRHWHLAMEIFDELGHTEAHQIRAKLSGLNR